MVENSSMPEEPKAERDWRYKPSAVSKRLIASEALETSMWSIEKQTKLGIRHGSYSSISRPMTAKSVLSQAKKSAMLCIATEQSVYSAHTLSPRQTYSKQDIISLSPKNRFLRATISNATNLLSIFSENVKF